MSYRTHRSPAADARLAGGPWDYIERIEITDRAAYDSVSTTRPSAIRPAAEVHTLLREAGASGAAALRCANSSAGRAPVPVHPLMHDARVVRVVRVVAAH